MLDCRESAGRGCSRVGKKHLVCVKLTMVVAPSPTDNKLLLQDAKEVLDLELAVLGQVGAVHGIHHLVQPVLRPKRLGPQHARQLRVMRPDHLAHSLDSMLVSVGEPLPAPTPLTVPDPLGGIHFSLVDNTWNTNCALHVSAPGLPPRAACSDPAVCSDPEWYPFIPAETATPFPGGQGDENSRFRFQIRLS